MVEAKILPRCYNLRQVAEHLCVSVKTVRRLIYNEELKAFKHRGRLYILSEVLESYWQKISEEGKVVQYAV